MIGYLHTTIGAVPPAASVVEVTNQTSSVLVVDGPSILHRAYHAYESSDLRDANGRPLWAVDGFFSLLGGICDKAGASGVAVGFDDDANSERSKIYPEYKSQRGERSPDLKEQLQRVQDMLSAMGAMVLRLPGWEGDDVLASVARACDAQAVTCFVATSDRDAFQLSSEQVTVMRIVSGLRNTQMITPTALHEKYGVYPTQYLDYAALRGDVSDNLPGVPGFGEKTAAKLLAQCGSVAAALADPAAVVAAVGPSAASKLVAGIEAYHRNIKVMSPHVKPINVRMFGRPAEQKVKEVLEAAGLTSTARRVSTQLGAAVQSGVPGPIAPASQQVEIPQQRVSAPVAAEKGAAPVWGGIWNLAGVIPGSSTAWPQTI